MELPRDMLCSGRGESSQGFLLSLALTLRPPLYPQGGGISWASWARDTTGAAGCGGPGPVGRSLGELGTEPSLHPHPERTVHFT